MAKAQTKTVSAPLNIHISRPGVHAKKKTSKLKTSKLYKKPYRGQGR
jgi:hypothetical protein